MSISLADLRSFVNSELIPLEPTFLQDSFGAILPKLRTLRSEVQRRGWWLPPLPHDYGGQGMPLTEFAAISEELGRTPIGHYTFNCQAPDVGNMELLHMHGNAEQRSRWLRPLAAGEIRSCFAMTEPEHAGSNPVWLDTSAVKDGDDYVINGHKWFTTAADGAAFTIVMAVTNPDAQPHLRASQIIVPLDTPGFKLVRNIKIMGEAGEDWASHAEVRFDNCRVPQSNRIGGEGAGFALAQDRLGPGRIHHCMRWIGICERALELMCRHAASRELAPGTMLGSRQAVQHWIAESRANINAARFMVMDAAHKIEHKGAHAARIEISTIKYFVAGGLQQTLDRAIQAHGALGITDDTPLAWWYRHERGARIYDGADEVHKNVVARQELKKYGVHIRD
ncbi:MAG: acyl-CoA dehydrogenase family protein [Anaerolineae bacterium]|nr:acyl-CoA dehydrogenase family protein [Anaerolineae bacterium]